MKLLSHYRRLVGKTISCKTCGVIASLLLTAISASWAKEPVNTKVDAIFADLTKPGSPGCALGVYRDGKIIYAKGYGLANLEENIPITPQSVFDIASISKQFTAASILLLEKEGKLSLNDDIRKYIPELPDYSQKITILQLLNHTSGLRDYYSLFPLAGIDYDDVTTDDDAFGIILRQKSLNFPPGSDWQYSGSGYFLLSLVVKRVSGKNLKDFAAENLFQPLGMIHTQYRNDHTSLIPNRALAYDPGENGDYKLSVSYAEETGDGMVHTTLEDLQKWDENFYSEKVGGKDFTEEMEKPGKLNDGRTLEYAKGLRVWSYSGLRAVGHTGASGGYRSYVVRFHEQHFSIACLCNLGNINRKKRVNAVAEAYLGDLLKPKDDAFTENLTPQQLHALVGTYRDPKTAEVWRIAVKETKLWADFEGLSHELRALSFTDFEPVEYVYPVTHLKFEPDLQKGPTQKLIVSKEMEFPAILEAIEELKPTSAELAIFAGDYWSDELRVTYRLAMKDGKLWMKDLIGADGIAHSATVPFTELRPVIRDEFDLSGAFIMFHFIRDGKNNVTGFKLDGFRERGILFERLKLRKDS